MSDISALTARVEKLEHELAIQQDIHQIRRVQYTYGYFIDKSQYNEVVDLFADDGGFSVGSIEARRVCAGCTLSAFSNNLRKATTDRVMAGCSITRRCRW